VPQVSPRPAPSRDGASPQQQRNESNDNKKTSPKNKKQLEKCHFPAGAFKDLVARWEEKPISLQIKKASAD